MKVGGDPTVRAMWKGPPLDRCCRVADSSGRDCRWHPPRGRARQTCPAGGPPASRARSQSAARRGVRRRQGQGQGEGTACSWRGSTRRPRRSLREGAGRAACLPPRRAAIAPADCELASHAVNADGTRLTFTLAHPPTALRFHVNASLAGPGGAGALNFSLHVELPRTSGSPRPRPRNVTAAFPFITGIAISGSGPTNVGINHFQTGLGTDGASLPAWRASGGLHGWHTHQLWSAAWEPSTGHGLSMIVMDTGVAVGAPTQRVLMRFPADGSSGAGAAPALGGMCALTYPATPLAGESGVVVEPCTPVQLFVHGGGWKVAARQYGRWLRAVVGQRAAWLDAVHAKGSAWVPDAAAVAASKLSGHGLTSFADLHEHYYAGNTTCSRWPCGGAAAVRRGSTAPLPPTGSSCRARTWAGRPPWWRACANPRNGPAGPALRVRGHCAPAPEKGRQPGRGRGGRCSRARRPRPPHQTQADVDPNPPPAPARA